VSDEFTVPLCSIHHSENHATGDERKWWQERKIEPLNTAAELWRQTRAGIAATFDPSSSPTDNGGQVPS
jgi:hypothetical protein